MKYLVDTDWVINHFRGSERVTRKLEELAPQGLALSIVSLAELYEGVYRSTNRSRDEQSITTFVGGTSILELSQDICRIFGRERARLKKEGRPIGDFDLLIASTCLHHDLTLLTDNVREFERVGGLKILRG